MKRTEIKLVIDGKQVFDGWFDTVAFAAGNCTEMGEFKGDSFLYGTVLPLSAAIDSLYDRVETEGQVSGEPPEEMRQ